MMALLLVYQKLFRHEKPKLLSIVYKKQWYEGEAIYLSPGVMTLHFALRSSVSVII